MPDVGRQRQHRLIDVHPLRLPLHDAAHDEGVAQIMDAGGVVSSTVAPAQLLAQLGEDAMYLAIAQRPTTPSAPRADEKWGIGLRHLARQVAHPAIATQGFDGARVHGYLARLAELGSMDGQHPALEIDVCIAQRPRLGDPQSGAGDQTEQRLEGEAAHARRRSELPRRGQQRNDLALAVDVRRLALGQAPIDRVIGNLGTWLELLQPAGERAQVLQSARPGARVTAAVAVATRPVGHGLRSQRSAMADSADMAREAAQGVGRAAQGEAQAATFDQIALDERLQGSGRAHAALPGHGRATSASLRLSSLA